MMGERFEISFNATISDFDNDLWGLYIELPPEATDIILARESRRILCQLDNKRIIHTAPISSGKGWWFILINQELAKSIGKFRNDQVQVTITPDESEFGMDLPEEFSVMMDQDEDARNYFEKLTPGKQRNLIYIVSKVKSTDSRIKKALAICHHLKESKGQLDFKKLNDTIKWYNNNI